ncbi:MAG: hypothetical protein HY596_03810 [Candidatus Omnitrophica bacterium]|nr:hypothetical protein [Candidatus Omnitrophota bacterium]
MAWSQIRGQQLAVTMLQADLAKQRVAPAYLFAGDTDAGTLVVALEMARALNCAQPSHGACGECDSCRRITRGVHPDVHQLNPQGAAANIRIEDVRQVLERMSLRPFMARAQVAVINGAECLTEEAGNLLLKSLEEAPASSRFILLTPQPSACLPTVVSRCKVVRFGRLPAGDVAALPPAMLAQFASEQPAAWLEWPVPTDREAVSQWLAGAIAWLRDVAVVGVGGDTLLTHPETALRLGRQAATLDRERCVETALRLVELSHSLDEQMVSARLIGTLFREHWLLLITHHSSLIT